MAKGERFDIIFMDIQVLPPPPPLTGPVLTEGRCRKWTASKHAKDPHTAAVVCEAGSHNEPPSGCTVDGNRGSAHIAMIKIGLM